MIKISGPLRATSLSDKLTWFNLAITGCALLLACLSFLIYDFYSYRNNLILNIRSAAQIAGANSISALTFDDPQVATATLAALKGSPDVESAAIIDEDGGTFAEYRRPDVTRELIPGKMSPKEASAVWIAGSEVQVAYRVVFSGDSIGIVYIQAHLGELQHRLVRYGMAALVILIFSLAAALIATATFRRLITRPLTALAGTVRVIAQEKDYSLRAAATANPDEIAVLVHAFNDMLEEIQQRDLALREARELLEKRVHERTAELRAANRELEAFAYSVAHDLRGPLDVIGGMSYVIQSTYGYKLEPEGVEMIETVQRSAKGMAELIDDLLNLSRATTAGLERREVDLTAIAQSIAGDLIATDPQRQVNFTIAKDAVVSADSGLMSVVMENLLRNAWKYTSHHNQAKIEFGWASRRGKRVFFVRDDGAGFEPREADRLFQPFQRLHSPSEFPGTGIGLATVQRIIARHGGRAWAQGQVEHGATFYFTL